jgi:DNA-directed RNA polymerase sigma subunit (sigma70/sigma32)
MIELLPDERDRQVVAMRYGLVDGNCMTFKEIADSLPEPISSGFARTIFLKAMARLRELNCMMETVSLSA